MYILCMRNSNVSIMGNMQWPLTFLVKQTKAGGDGFQHAYKAALPLSRRAMWTQSLNAVLWSHDVRSGETKPT